MDMTSPPSRSRALSVPFSTSRPTPSFTPRAAAPPLCALPPVPRPRRAPASPPVSPLTRPVRNRSPDHSSAPSDASSAYSLALPEPATATSSIDSSANSSSTTLPHYPGSPITLPPPALKLPFPAAKTNDKQKEKDVFIDVEKALPTLPETGPVPTSLFFLVRSAVFNTYRRLFTLVTLGNIAAFIFVLLRDRKTSDILNITAANLLVTGLIRNPLVINALYAVMGSLPRSAPLKVRVWAARVFQFGGVHSGCAMAALMWYVAFLTLYTVEVVNGGGLSMADVWPIAVICIGYSIVVLLLAVIVAALPSIRRRYHNHFEWTHRLGAWSCVALFWALLFAVTEQQAIEQQKPVGLVLASTPAFWFNILITLALIQPWLHLRRVRVEPERLSNHVTRLHFDYTTPSFTQGISVSRHPLTDWHSFATVSDKFDNPSTKFSTVVSRAGDFTGELIDNPPKYLWKRSIPVHGFGNSMTMFGRVLMVATGSGIGPLVGFLGDENRGAMRVIWQTRDPVKTYGQRIIDLVHRMDSDALILDSTKMGKRTDMVPLVLREFHAFEAEAVCIISNEKMTKKLVFECEARGVPAFGPVFDS
jgi:NAD(P)H-flavin reductase